MPSAWKKTFEDHFSGTTLDTAKWVIGLWSHSPTQGGLGGSGELQWYHPRNVSVQADGLRLVAKREAYNNFTWTSGVVTTGRVGTTDPLKFQVRSPDYYIEAKAKVAAGAGMWSGVWLCAQYGDYPSPLKECDIVEQLGKSPAISYSTFHNPDSGTFATDNGIDLSKDFHFYGYRQFSDGIGIWYVDRVPKRSFVSSSFRPEIPMYILCNLAVGGWGGTPDPALIRAEMKIDWIRVWERLG